MIGADPGALLAARGGAADEGGYARDNALMALRILRAIIARW